MILENGPIAQEHRNLATNSDGQPLMEAYLFTIPGAINPDIVEGSLNCYYYPVDRKLLLFGLNVDPDHRRQGKGKDLLRAALATAIDIDALLIEGHMMSRESLDAMATVFGTEAITVLKEGHYGATDTRASLNFSLDTIAA